MAVEQPLVHDTSETQSAQSEPHNRTLIGLPGYFAEMATDDRLIYEKVRLGIMSALAVNQSLTFSELKDLLKTSDGNLSVHARKLEDAAYIICHKKFKGRIPKTEYRLTEKGRKAFDRYLNHMEALIQMTRTGTA